jgi:hypothetical protein
LFAIRDQDPMYWAWTMNIYIYIYHTISIIYYLHTLYNIYCILSD